MNVIPRTIAPLAQKLFSQYPVLTVTGPRQSGKTTLVREIFPGKPYANFERPDTRAWFEEDPKGFLHEYPDGAIFDEIQRVPEFSSWLQVLVDERQRNGLFVLTGSTQWEMMQQVTQSLAGRTALLRLLPFSWQEISAYQRPSLNDLLLKGFYPRIYQQNLNPTQYYADYVQTYLEKDLRQMINLKNLSLFQQFLRLCAGRVGQLVNRESLANEVGVSGVTIREWLSLLEAGYIIFFLKPWHRNHGKRLVKKPKLYFYDPGLAAYLCGMEEPAHIKNHPLRGAFFENLVVVEALKTRFNQGKEGNLYFYRDSRGKEVDLLYPDGPSYIPIEIKSAQTVSSSFFSGITEFARTVNESTQQGMVVYAGDEEQSRSVAKVLSWERFSRALKG